MPRYCLNPDCARELPGLSSSKFCGSGCRSEAARKGITAQNWGNIHDARYIEYMRTPKTQDGLEMITPQDFPADDDAQPVPEIPPERVFRVEPDEYRALYDFFCAFANWRADRWHAGKREAVMRTYAGAKRVYERA